MINNKKVFRFAPSPTGNMHLGNIRTAIVNYYGALQCEGEFFLRIDDTDADRDKEEYESNIYKDLEWLEIKYKTIIKQSERTLIYEEYFNKLKDMGKVYECFETEDELEEGVIYNRKALYLTEEEKTELRKTRIPYWRFFMSNNYYEFKDNVMGTIKTKRSWSDPVIKRPKEHKAFTYNFTSAIDDFLMGVTDIIRGQEHLNNGIIQQEIISSLGGHIINFSHIPIIITPSGQKLSKRLGDLSIKTLREEGYFFTTIISMCLSLGTNKTPLITTKIEDFINYFNVKNFSRSSPKFEKKQIEILNKKILQVLRKEDINKLNFNENIWDIIKYNISNLNEYDKWHIILNNETLYKELSNENKMLLEKLYVNKNLNFKEIEDVEKRKEFLISLHNTLTGETTGPEINKILNYKMEKFPLLKNLLVL
jgi:glutamyl-tRNA synthetase